MDELKHWPMQRALMVWNFKGLQWRVLIQVQKVTVY